VPHQGPESVLALPDVVVLGLRGNLDAVGGAEEDGLQHSHGLVNLTGIYVSVRAEEHVSGRRGQLTSPWGERQRCARCPSWDQV
jgi:hypothetical protein